MIINTPAIDYYRATTSEFDRYYEMVTELVGYEQEDNMWTFQQYKGNRVGSVGHGEAMQGASKSYIIDISGESADDYMGQLIYSDMKVTRLDLQITIEMPSYWDALEFYYQMENGVWTGKKRDVDLRKSKTGTTVYVGDRTSGRFIRVYEKSNNLVRFEVEFKKDLAVKAWQAIRNGRRVAMAGILTAESQRLPESKFLDDIRTELAKWSTLSLKLKVERVESTDMTRIKWLASLLPTIEKMMNDSDYGRMVTGWFVDLVEKQINGYK